jgi:carbamoyltransferase
LYRHRRKRIAEILRDEFDISAPVKFLHHHHAHAASAYYTSGFDDALVVTMDGGGDGDCCHVYDGRGGQLKLLQTIDSYHSLGNYYAYVTALCGFKAKRHEGKITGLAAHGRPVHEDLLASMINCRNGRLANSGRVLFNGALERLRARLPADWAAADLAASIQKVSEDVARSFVRYWVEKTGHRNVALAGGLFANVRINEEILGLDPVENVFIHPGMSDEGLGVGAALALDHETRSAAGLPYQAKFLPHVYLGTDIDEAASLNALRNLGLEVERPGDMASRVADLLANGHVVARAAGRMEYGPRALGNRTIMFNPSDPTVNDWLNDLLHRTEFMPFAPSCLDEAANELFVNVDGARDAARFMTITFHTTHRMNGLGGGAVHLDGTARPQLVRRQDAAEYHDIIARYRSLTDMPAIINTSFNMHEEPIVCTADDAVRAFLDSSLDYMQLGPFVVKGPKGSAEARGNVAEGGSRRLRALAQSALAQTCR